MGGKIERSSNQKGAEPTEVVRRCGGYTRSLLGQSVQRGPLPRDGLCSSWSKVLPRCWALQVLVFLHKVTTRADTQIALQG